MFERGRLEALDGAVETRERLVDGLARDSETQLHRLVGVLGLRRKRFDHGCLRNLGAAEPVRLYCLGEGGEHHARHLMGGAALTQLLVDDHRRLDHQHGLEALTLLIFLALLITLELLPAGRDQVVDVVVRGASANCGHDYPLMVGANLTNARLVCTHYSISVSKCQYPYAKNTTRVYPACATINLRYFDTTVGGHMSTIDQQFIEYIVKSVVGHPDDVVIERVIDEKGVLLTLTVNPEDLGRVIGKRGITAQSLRTLLRALGTKNDARYNLKIVNNDGQTGAVVSSDDTSGDDSAQAVDSVTDEAVDNTSDYTKKTRAELAELDDLDI